MEFLITLIVVIFGIGIVTGINAYYKRSDVQRPPEKRIVKRFSKEEIRSRLIELAVKPPPKELGQGAMCYSQVAPPDRAEYVCPKDGEKTLYNAQMVHEVLHEIPAVRSAAASMPGVSITVDESEFCKKCSPNTKLPQISVTIQFDDYSTTVKGVSSTDMDILREFLTGQQKHSDSYDFETPLKDHIPRLEILLGVKTGK